MSRRAARLLGPSFFAQIFINGIPLQFKHLHDCYGSMTGSSPVWASNGAPVDVRTRMNTRFADA
jgi:hypothetical protein